MYLHTYQLQNTNTEKDSISQSSWLVCDVTDGTVGGRWDRQEAANVSSHVICTIHQITCHDIHNVYYTLLHIISCTRQLKGRTCQKKGQRMDQKGLKNFVKQKWRNRGVPPRPPNQPREWRLRIQNHQVGPRRRVDG